MDEFCLHVFCSALELKNSDVFFVGKEELIGGMARLKAEPRYVPWYHSRHVADKTTVYRLQKLVSLATTVVGIPVQERSTLEDWVHPDGPMIIVGEAAHPLTVSPSSTPPCRP